ncbi:apolipoprotein N-acyltransferase [Scleromatobacter humisilvae]|uniref:Apolipoprotein N-acyltransferase n=1 Tax=Scleromatobacter humisilvae TaxID=2897159 RepID=A0A9X1YMU3_9BURK|nr:apolipoprotein N-acyltransferase [Scleromatobacter humisilvae]MCK9689078.1 apolipoprotein N-acyltransferase [Scleromatobacter humisilvae]
MSRAPRHRSRVSAASGWIAFLLALLAGVAQAASFAPTEFWWLQLLSTGALVALLADARPRAAAARAWAFGFGWMGVGFWWLYISLHVYGLLPAWLSVLAVAVLAALLSLYYAIAGWAWATLRRNRPWIDALLFSGVWLLAELARGKFLTGFPWIAGGYAHTSGPLASWAPYVGVYGIGALAAGISAATALVALTLRGQQVRPPLVTLSPLVLPLLLLAVGAALPQGFTRSTGMLSVSLLQPNVAQNDKFEQSHIDQALAWHVARLNAAPGQLVVTPESSLPVLPVQIPPETWLAYEHPFNKPGKAALVGVFTGDDEHGYTNSLVGLDATHHMSSGTFFRYGKRHLLPFGEYVPPGFHWFVAMLQIPIGDQAAGVDTASFTVGAQRVRPLICYEDLFGEDFATSMVGLNAATLMANSTNLAWFGKRMIQDQHLQFSRMRALEFQRGQVRATNTGATAVIDWQGRVTARLPPDVEGELDAEVEGRIGDTPYGIWLAQWRLWPLWGLGLALILVALLVPRLR